MGNTHGKRKEEEGGNSTKRIQYVYQIEGGIYVKHLERLGRYLFPRVGVKMV